MGACLTSLLVLAVAPLTSFRTVTHSSHIVACSTTTVGVPTWINCTCQNYIHSLQQYNTSIWYMPLLHMQPRTKSSWNTTTELLQNVLANQQATLVAPGVCFRRSDTLSGMYTAPVFNPANEHLQGSLHLSLILLNEGLQTHYPFSVCI